MYWKLFVSLLPHLLVCNTVARSVYENVENDVAAVGSFIHEIRQPAPLELVAEVRDLMSASNAPKSQDTKKNMKNASGKSDEGGYYKTYGSDAEGEKGYLEKTYDKGDQGYKTLDTFHKQDNDKYEIETLTTFGKNHDDDKKQHNEEKNDHEGAGTMINANTDHAGEATDHDEGSEYSHYSGGDGGHYSHYTESEPKSYSYSEKHSSGDSGDGSYETHSSYSSGGEEGEGDHY